MLCKDLRHTSQRCVLSPGSDWYAQLIIQMSGDQKLGQHYFWYLNLEHRQTGSSTSPKCNGPFCSSLHHISCKKPHQKKICWIHRQTWESWCVVIIPAPALLHFTLSTRFSRAPEVDKKAERYHVDGRKISFCASTFPSWNSVQISLLHSLSSLALHQDILQAQGAAGKETEGHQVSDCSC